MVENVLYAIDIFSKLCIWLNNRELKFATCMISFLIKLRWFPLIKTIGFL